MGEQSLLDGQTVDTHCFINPTDQSTPASPSSLFWGDINQ
jgi:hypothetical protein